MGVQMPNNHLTPFKNALNAFLKGEGLFGREARVKLKRKSSKKVRVFPLKSCFLKKITYRNLKLPEERFVLLTVAMLFLTAFVESCFTREHRGTASLQFRTNMIC